MRDVQRRLCFGPYELVNYNNHHDLWALPGHHKYHKNYRTTGEVNALAKDLGLEVEMKNIQLIRRDAGT